MSPTLLELIVAIFVIWLAWQIGVLIAPRVLASLVAFWRTPKSPPTTGPWRAEKNITPPSAAPGDNSPPHGKSPR